MRHEEVLSSIRALAKGEAPASDIAAFLYAHNCTYLLSRIPAPHAYTDTLRAETALNAICVRERYTQCRCIFEALETSSIPYAVIKGAVLSQEAYGDSYCRKSCDIDLLINRRDIDYVKQILFNNGFVQGRVTDEGIVPFIRQEVLFQTTMSHQTAPFIKKADNPLCPYVNMDVNMDILWGESEIKADMDFVLSGTEQAAISGVSIRKLPREMEFASLCLHHYKDMNSIYLLSHSSLKLSLFCDIYFYVSRRRPDAAKLKAVCDRLEILEYVYYCLYYTQQIFGTPLLNSYLDILWTDRFGEKGNTFGLAMDEKKEWELSFYERLFSTDVGAYLEDHLSDKELEKIRTNERYM